MVSTALQLVSWKFHLWSCFSVHAICHHRASVELIEVELLGLEAPRLPDYHDGQLQGNKLQYYYDDCSVIADCKTPLWALFRAHSRHITTRVRHLSSAHASPISALSSRRWPQGQSTTPLPMRTSKLHFISLPVFVTQVHHHFKSLVIELTDHIGSHDSGAMEVIVRGCDSKDKKEQEASS